MFFFSKRIVFFQVSSGFLVAKVDLLLAPPPLERLKRPIPRCHWKNGVFFREFFLRGEVLNFRGILDVPLEVRRINGDRINGLVITDPYKWGMNWGYKDSQVSWRCFLSQKTATLR